MCLVLHLCHRAADFEHIHVVVVTVVAVSTQVEVLGQDVLHALPGIIDVACRAPGVGDVSRPDAGECPTADVEHDILVTRVLQRVGDGGVALLLVHLDLPIVAPRLTAAIIHLDEVEVMVFEEEVGVLLVVTIEAHAGTRTVGVVDAATGVLTRIAVDTGLQAEAVDVFHDGRQPIREALRMYAQPSVLIATVEVTVIDVHILVTCRLQPALVHRIRLSFDNILTDVEGKRVPRRPAHGRRALCSSRSGHQQQQKEKISTHKMIVV